MSARRLLIVLGMPRSGTTWLAKVLDSHPDTVYVHEPDSVQRLEDIPLVTEGADRKAYGEALRGFVGHLPRITAPKVCGKLPLFPKTYLSAPGLQLLRASVLLARVVSPVMPNFPVLGAAMLRRSPEASIVWKSIESLGRIGLIAREFSDARILHLIRHPCGYAASVLRGEKLGAFVDATPASDDYGIYRILLETGPAQRRQLTLDYIQSLRPIERLAWRWVLFNEAAMEQAAGLENCHLVRYEDLCKEPEPVGRRVFDFIGLSWNEQTQAFLLASTESDTRSYFGLYKNPSLSAAKWRQELAPEDVGRILDITQESAPGRLFESE